MKSSNEIIHNNHRIATNNIETRIASRMQSIFAAAGQIVNDFYLEIGIYCIGLLNAALVAWSIYTGLLNDSQPLLYAITLGIIALVAVEGLAVYLVGAAAKTNNSWLWFFSVVFAGFFTFAHSYGSANISHYITWAIPFFVVIGYWARTIKVETETGQVDKTRLEREELERKRQIEDEERRQKMELERVRLEQKQALKMAQIEGQIKVSMNPVNLNSSDLSRVTPNLDTVNDTKKTDADTRRQEVKNLLETGDMSYSQIATELGVSLSTIKRDAKALNGSVSR